MKALLKILLLLGICLLGSIQAYADGSRDMYYPGVNGNRAYLVSTEPFADLFGNNAAHYAYVEAGETLAVASSAQRIENGHIRITSPDGSFIIDSRDSPHGFIANRAQEVAGPDAPGGYTPIKHLVLPGQGGIWKIEFFAPRHRQENPPNVKADQEFVQPATNHLIAAWDVSVRNAAGTGWIEGRVFTHVLNLYLTGSTLDQPDGSFYGKNFVLTKDGYVYQIDGNGSHGILFYYFVNNSGFLDAGGNPTYKSANSTSTARFHNPNAPDNGSNITHKMFYTIPDRNLPESAFGAVPGGNTWLYNEIKVAHVTDINLQHIEDAGILVNSKGAHITYRTTYEGRYKITIKSADPEHSFVPAEFTHQGQSGLTNFAWWDGKDGDGKYVIGEGYPISISVALMEGEIHFPYFDMEINPNGIRIDMVDMETMDLLPTMGYWDDSEISPGSPGEEPAIKVNLNGIMSDVMRHSWGTYRSNSVWMDPRYSGNDDYGAFSFGNNKAIDTWSYTAFADESMVETISIRVSDLEIVSITASQDIIEPDDMLTYDVVIRNNGPSDALGAAFEFDLPAGFIIQEVLFASECDESAETSPRSVTGNQVRSTLNIPNGCTVHYAISVRTGNPIPDETYGPVPVFAGIVRPVGYTDPDATSTDATKDRPGSAREECPTGNCNNIKYNHDVFLLEYENERGNLALVKEVQHIGTATPGFFEVGDILRYTFTVTNVGPIDGVSVSNIQITDPMLSASPIVPPNTTLHLGETTTVSREYRVTQADIDRKHVDNTATVLGENPRGFDVKDVSGTNLDNNTPTRIVLDKQPIVQLRKTVTNKGTGEDDQFTIGDKIIYRFEIRHEGDISMDNIEIIDAKIQDTPLTVEAGSISNEVHVVLAAYEVTEEDIAAGSVFNSATIQGLDSKYGNSLSDISGVAFENDLPTVTPLATAPNAQPDYFEIYQGNNGVFDVMNNDEPGSSTLNPNSLEIVVPPSMGSVFIKGGKIHYEPKNNFTHGDDKFIYRIQDNSRLYSQPIEVNILIKRTIPVAVDDFLKIGYNHYARLRPVQNDYVDHSHLLPESIEILGYPLYGDVIHHGNGVLTYHPHTKFSGHDKITYQIMDKNGNWSEPATVEVEVSGFILPNAITPNGDGKNETLEIIGLYKFDYVEIEVIDRFGRRIFQSDDYKNNWEVPTDIAEGTYFVLFRGVKVGEKPVVRKGSVLIKRTNHTRY